MDTLLIILLVLAHLMLATTLFLKKKKIEPVKSLPEIAAEYFFEYSNLLQTKHPELYNILLTIFRQQPQKPESL
jgi:hypothetical protein